MPSPQEGEAILGTPHKQTAKKLLLAVLAGSVPVLGWLLHHQQTRARIVAQLPAVPDLDGRVGRLVEEISRLDSEARASPLSVPAIARLAMTYHASERPVEAMACYRIAARLSPRDYRWAYYMAILLEGEGDYDQAILLLQRVTKCNPEYVHAWARLGNLFFKETRLVDAERALQEALSRDPLHPRASLVKARIAAWQEDWQQVSKILSPIVQKHPLFAPACRLLVRAHTQLGLPPPELDEPSDTRIPVEDVTDEPLMDAIYDLSALALIPGNPERGQRMMNERCMRCHTLDRINSSKKDRKEWLRTVRRMQRLSEPGWLDDVAAADILAYLRKRAR